MATFLVITFDRYCTENSTHEYVEAETHKEAIIKTANDNAFDDEDDEEGFADYIEGLIVVKGDVASVSEEESDFLSYKLRSVK